MIDFNQYFEDPYQFALKEVRYELIEKEVCENEIEIKIFDEIELKEDERLFDITFYRNVRFEPETLFQLKVAYSIKLNFKENIDVSKIDIDWNKELMSNENLYIQNVASRASNLIANITSSYGREPLITPPVLINK